jgi:CheY-like chemotaxis protein
MVVNTLSCFFPTTVAFIDDDVSFMDALTNQLEDKRSFITKKYCNPIQALQMINETSRSNSLGCFDLIRDRCDNSSFPKAVDIDISCLHREIYNNNRFSKISAVVVDYMMPEMDGIAFCSKIADKNIQRILLTGVSGTKMAIDAFNEGLINRFIRKGTEALVHEVTEGIRKAIYRYFSVKTSEIASHLYSHEYSHLKDPIFADFFFKSYFADKYVEYYMLDAYGSYMFLDGSGQASVLSVMSENELGKIVRFGIESGISSDVLQKLQSRKFLLVSHRRDGQLPPVAEWSKYLRPANRIDCYQTYYFAVFDDMALDVDFDKVVNFNSFKLAHNIP